MRLLIFGPPGAGKGTVAKEICGAAGLRHISTGDMLRAAVAAGSELGLKVKSILDAGGLVSDDVMIELVADRLSQADVAGGWLLDGFPRTLPQGAALDGVLARLGQGLDLVVLVTVPDDTIIERLGGRRVCLNCGATYHVVFSPPSREGHCDQCGQDKVVLREDDQPATIAKRLATYHAQTAPLIDFYEAKGLVKPFDNSGAAEQTVARVREALAAL